MPKGQPFLYCLDLCMRNIAVFVYDADKEINRIPPKAPTRFSTNGGKRNENEL